MTKARTLANFVSAGNPLADGTIDVVDINGLTTTVDELNILSGIAVTKPEHCKNLFRFIPEFGRGGTVQVLSDSIGRALGGEPAGVGGGGSAASHRAVSFFPGQDGGAFGGGGAGGKSKSGGNGGWGAGGGAGYNGGQVTNYDAPGGAAVTILGGLGGWGIIFVEYLSA